MLRTDWLRYSLLAAVVLLLLLPLLLPLQRLLMSVRELPPSAVASLVIGAGANHLSLQGHLAQLLDDERRFDIDHIRHQPEQAFTPLSDNVNVGYRDTVVWLRFSLQREHDAPDLWWLVVNPPFLDRVTLYSADPNDSRGIDIAIARNWAGRSIVHRTAIFPIELTAEEDTIFYLRLDNATALFAEPVLWQPDVYLNQSVRMALLHGGLFVTALAIVLINLFYWFTLHRPLFLAYVSFVASVALLLFQSEGYLLWLLQPESLFPVKILQGLTQVAAVASFYAVFLALVEPQRRWPRLIAVFSRTTWGFCILMTLFMLLGWYAVAVPALWGYVLVLFIFDALLCVRLAAEKDRRATNYLLCFLVLLVSVGLRLVYLFGLLPGDFNFSHVFVVACLIHWVLLQLVVVDQINQLRREQEQAREEAVALSRSMEKELEQRVTQRTEDLRQTSATLEQELQERVRLTDDLERTQQALEQSLEHEKEINAGHHQFLRLVGHEFRTPLGVIAGSSELLEESEDACLRRRALERLNSATQRIRNLVDQALHHDRIGSALWRANMASFALENLVQEVADYGRTMDQQHRIVVNCPPLKIQADRELLGVALHNLLDNAIKYAPAQTTITLGATITADRLLLTVADEGEVLPQKEVPHLFTRYYRRDGQGEPGLGLGLYLVDHIVRLHGGSIRVESAKGQGNRFVMELPRGAD